MRRETESCPTGCHDMQEDHPERKLVFLVAEDEPLLLMGYEDAILDAGCTCLAATCLTDGISLLRHHIDVAILDIRLGTEKVFPLARRLAERGVPFIFCSGTPFDAAREGFNAALLLSKPLSASYAVEQAMALHTRTFHLANGLGSILQ